jgi:hypothetical protein
MVCNWLLVIVKHNTLAYRVEIGDNSRVKDHVHPSSLSPGHRVRYTSDYNTESAGNETLIYVEPEHPKPTPKISIKLIPSNPLHSATKSLRDAFANWNP